MPPEAKRLDSIAVVKREAWNACFPGELEEYDYLLAVERSHIKGFKHVYYTVMDGDNVLAAIPAFFTDYDLATTADGKIRDVLLAIKRIAPSLLTLKLACLGSYATETCPIGFHPSLDEIKRRELCSQLLAFFDRDTKSHRINLLAFKDVNDVNNAQFGDLLNDGGYLRVPGMPSAISHINFATIDEYLAGLSAATRKDMRRKLKKRSDIRIEYRSNIDDLINEIYVMYLETKNRSDLQFEELTPDYFREVLRCKGSVCALYFTGEILIGANLMLMNNERLLDKFFCMRTNTGQDYNLYFVSWFSNLQFCIDRKLKYYQSGQAGYETKLRLGSDLLANWMFFRHRNSLADKLLRLASPLLAFDVPQTL